ncbi:TolC family protein [Luteimonas salinilitoris]|uniref:TolC family protein n=1 Tax=Luteimonas salinilitoris TaxID=3237697 RepID=A0ABV4HS50_9GAMM
MARLERNPSFEASAAQRAGADAAHDTARALRYPHIGLSGVYGRFSDPVEIDLGPLNDLIHLIDPQLPALPNPVLQPERFAFAMATVTWPVFTGGRIDAARQATAAGQRSAQAKQDATRNALVLDLVARYHGVTIAERAASVQDGMVESLREHLRNARALEGEGQIAAAERMRAEVALAQAEAAQQQRRHALQLARAGLANLLGVDPQVEPVTALAEPPPPEAQTDLQTAALASHPVLQQLAALAEQAEQGVRAARAEYWPTIAVVGGYEVYNYQLPELIPEWTVGVNLTMPLFDGGARRAKVAGARAQWDEAKALQREAGDRIRLLVQERYLAQDDARRRLDVAVRTETLASESLRLQKVAFREGVGRSVDVVDAENALATARLARLAARYDSALAWTALMLAAGRRLEVERVFSRPGPEVESDAS